MHHAEDDRLYNQKRSSEGNVQNDFIDFGGESKSMSKEKFSVDVSAIESGGRPSRMQASKHANQGDDS